MSSLLSSVLIQLLLMILCSSSIRAATIIVDDANNPEEGDNDEFFVVTESVSVGIILDDTTGMEFSDNDYSGCVMIDVTDLSYVTYNGIVYVAFGTELNEKGNLDSFTLESFTVTSGGVTYYDLDEISDNSVVYNEVNDDPLTTPNNDNVEFNNGGADTDTAILIPVSSFEGLTQQDTLEFCYDYDGLTPGRSNNELVTGTDGTIFTFPLPEPSSTTLLGISVIGFLLKRKR